jgi:hypothetical protein
VAFRRAHSAPPGCVAGRSPLQMNFEKSSMRVTHAVPPASAPFGSVPLTGVRKLSRRSRLGRPLAGYFKLQRSKPCASRYTGLTPSPPARQYSPRRVSDRYAHLPTDRSRSMRIVVFRCGRSTSSMLAARDAGRYGVLEALVICPSNLYLSVDPILAVSDLRRALLRRHVRCIALSPLVGGQAGQLARFVLECSTHLAAGRACA